MIRTFRFSPVWRILALVTLLAAGLSSCDRGAGEEIGVANKFADAVATNNTRERDSMIATQKFKDYFQNAYVANDMLQWFRSFYDYHTHKFLGAATADVDYDLTPKLQGALIDTNDIEQSGMVIVQSPTPGQDPAYFWIVKQKDEPWRVAVVTKGESEVNFQ